MSDTEGKDESVDEISDDFTKGGQCTPIGLAFPPVGTNVMFVTGVVTVQGIATDNTCVISLSGIPANVVKVPNQVTIPAGAKSAAVPAIITPTTTGKTAAVAASVSAAPPVTALISIMSSDAAVADNECDNSSIEIKNFSIDTPGKGATKTKGHITLNAPVNCDAQLSLGFIPPPPPPGAFVFPCCGIPPDCINDSDCVPIQNGADHVDFDITIEEQAEAFSVQAYALFQSSTANSNIVKVPAK